MLASLPVARMHGSCSTLAVEVTGSRSRKMLLFSQFSHVDNVLLNNEKSKIPGTGMPEYQGSEPKEITVQIASIILKHSAREFRVLRS